MTSPTGIFWDIENIPVQDIESTCRFINLIRGELLQINRLNEVTFVCACVKSKLNREVSNELVKQRILVEDVPKGPDSADLHLLQLMDKFVTTYKGRSTIVLISGDSDYIKSLRSLKAEYQIRLITVHHATQYSRLLDAIADQNYKVTDDYELESITDWSDVAAVKIVFNGMANDRFNHPAKKNFIDLMFCSIGGLKETIFFDNSRSCYWVNFECEESAKMAVARNQTFDTFLTANYVHYPSDGIIRRLLELNVNRTVRRKKLDIIDLSLHRKSESYWEYFTNSHKSISTIKFWQMIPCVLVIGLKCSSLSEAETFIETHFGVQVQVFWQNDDSVAFYRLENDEQTGKIIEKINNANQPETFKLRARLFLISPVISKFVDGIVDGFFSLTRSLSNRVYQSIRSVAS